MNTEYLTMNLYRMFVFYHSGCGTGYFSTYPDPSSCECEPCPIGTYNEREHADSCIPCQEGFTTSQEGSTTGTECYKSNSYKIINKK